MNLRLTCAVGLVVLAGCGGSKAPTSEAGTQPPATETSVDRGTETASVPAATESASSATFESLSTSMQQAVQNENFEEALKFAERALELQSETPSLLFMASQLAQQLGMQGAQAGGDREIVDEHFVKSAAYVRRIKKPRSELVDSQLDYLSQVFYNEACALANRGEDEPAIAALLESFECGFDDFRQLESDADLTELLKSPKLAPVVAARREEKQQRRLAEVKEAFAGQQPFDFDFELVSSTGKPVKLADYKGKVLIVDFWGTWCPPCKQEIPHFVELLANYKAAGLEIVGINYENVDAATASEIINGFAKENSVTYPCLIGDEVTQSRVPNFQGYPTTLFIDAAGKVRLLAVGYHPYDDLEAIVETLLAEAGKSS